MILTESQVLPLLDPVLKVRKKYPLYRFTDKDKELDYEFYDGYIESIRQKEAISYHTVKGKKPVKMLSEKAPNQSEDELAYVLANFKQNTLPVSFEFLSTIARGLHSGNWSRDYAQDKSTYLNSDMGFKKYLEEDIAKTPLRMNYDSWVQHVLPPVKINDAMGVIAVKPWKGEETTLDAEGNQVIAGDKLPEPIPYYFGCERVLSDPEWGYLMVETNEYSVIEFAGKETREGLVFEVYDFQSIWKVSQTGKKSDWKFKTELYFEHNLGYIPATYLKGRGYYTEGGTLRYDSPFLQVTDILDEALIDGCNLRSTKASCTYPQKVMLGNACRHRDENDNICDNGFIRTKSGDGYYRCGECGGSGQLPKTGPTNTLFLPERSELTGGEQIKAGDALAYVSPSTDTPRFLREEISLQTNSALSILHINTTPSIPTVSPTDSTATEHLMNEKARYSFISTIVEQVFDIDEFLCECMGKMRYGTDYMPLKINRPTTYDFNSEVDYLKQISAMQESQVPPSLILPYVYKYLKAIFYDNPRAARSYDIIIAADRLFSMTRADIMAELPRNLIQNWEVTLHNSSFFLIEQLVREDDNYLFLDLDEAIQILTDRAKLITPQPLVAATRLNPQSILANANA